MQNLNGNQKRTLSITFAIIILIIVVVATVFYIAVHPTHYKYNDSWIIGKTLSEVEERYGPFDIRFFNSVGYYIYTDNKGFLPDHLKHYYYMKYDEETEVIYSVYDACQPGG